jgi:glycosyltransferase involved in cell wall biosynthesis
MKAEVARPDDQPMFSIVTVVYNAAALIEGTGRSLREQTWRDYEWLVVDGRSRDDTLALASGLGVPNTRIHSEPDRGIYDAMNKGIRLARGRWLYFLNAGDSFVDATVLADVARCLAREPDTRLLHGNIRHLESHRIYTERTAYVNRWMLMFEELNHQSVFAHRELFEALGDFNLAYRTSADYDWLIRVFRSGAKVRHLDRTVANFLDGGMHSLNPDALATERHELRTQYAQPWLLFLGAQIARVRRRLRLLAIREEWQDSQSRPA